MVWLFAEKKTLILEDGFSDRVVCDGIRRWRNMTQPCSVVMCSTERATKEEIAMEKCNDGSS